MVKKYKNVSIIGVLLIILVLQLPFFNVLAQNAVLFYPNDKFDIPENNSTIHFSSAGSYEMADLDKGRWNFVNFQLNDGINLHTFNVSAINSNVTIYSIQVFDDDLGAFLSYTVEGAGEQTFNFGVDTVGGEWSVIFDNVFIAENSGWNLLPDNTLSITGATSNVTLLYFIFPDFVDNDTEKSFFDKHSVSISITIIVIIVLIIGITVRYANQKISKKN